MAWTWRKQCIGVVSICAVALWAQENEGAGAVNLRPIESYQIQSQYGPQVGVLNPIFPKDEKFEFTLALNYSPISSLYDYFGVAGGVIYHFNQRHAIEPLWVQYNFGELSNFATTEIRDKLSAVDQRKFGVDLPRTIISSSYVFTPYYTKMHVTDMSVLHMDIYTSIGPALIQTEQLLLNGDTGDSTWRFGGALAAGVKFLMKSRFGVRIELRDFIHPAKNIGADQIVNDLQLTAGMSVFLGSFPDYTNY